MFELNKGFDLYTSCKHSFRKSDHEINQIKEELGFFLYWMKQIIPLHRFNRNNIC